MVTASPKMKKYFTSIDKSVKKCLELATAARATGLDPETEVSIPLAKNMAERVVGLISVVAPQIKDTTVTDRIVELEDQYGKLDWRVALTVAEEVAKEKFCKFKDKKEAMEIGIRVGFAYLTLGVVSAPLEGFIGIKIKKRKDGKEYVAPQYAGPIRGAGGTGASVSVLITDYVRTVMGYEPWDPTPNEIARYNAEIHDYHDRITNLQYHPSDKEMQFLVKHLPVEVDGDPTERIEVSNYKDEPRIDTNLIRGGVALVLAEGITQKSPKLWKQLSKWGEEFGLNWGWLKDFIALKEEIHASHGGGKKKDKKKAAKKTVKPNNTFIMDLVAGRPILTHPMEVGGFRLRYGRPRTGGMYAVGMHPCTMAVLNDFIAVGTQMKVERPRKGATATVCDTLEGPVVKLEDGQVLQLKDPKEAKQYLNKVKEVIFLGDILFNYGDFCEAGHMLVPVGYCPEWWVQEVEKSIKENFEDNLDKVSEVTKIEKDRLDQLLKDHMYSYPTFKEAVALAVKLKTPLHSEFLAHWKCASISELNTLIKWMQKGRIKAGPNGIEKIILPYFGSDELHKQGKKILEKIGLSHIVVNKENVIIEKVAAKMLLFSLNIKQQADLNELVFTQDDEKTMLDILNERCSVKIHDKCGTFIGARMGRPEKAKMRHLTGSPQVMFPVGEEGDRLRSFQAALKAGKVNSSFPLLYCEKCKKDMIYGICDDCGSKCIQKYHCRFCGDLDKEECRHGPANTHKRMDIDIKYYFDNAKKRLGEKLHPDLIKGIRGTSNKDHVVEHLAKGILRAKHSVYVNKDGTTRYDATQLPLTHFKPIEIHAPVEKLIKLGYTHDIHGKELERDDQILEIKPQDIVLPGNDEMEESGPNVLSRVAKYVDELLVKFYKLKPHYKVKKPEDLIGHLVIGLAPHISAGIVGRIIGHSKTQGLLAHPMFHAAMRRDCLVYDTYVPIYDGEGWQVRRIGDYVEEKSPKKKADSYGTLAKKVTNQFTLSFNTRTSKMEVSRIKEVTKHKPSTILKIETQNGREIKTTTDHLFYCKKEDKIMEKRANQLTPNDKIIVPHKIDVPSKKLTSLFIPDFYNNEDLMISNIDEAIKKKIKNKPSLFKKRYNLTKSQYDNFTVRGRWPLKLAKKILTKMPSKATLSIKRDTILMPSTVKITDDLLWLIGLYVAEGFSRKKEGSKSYYQVSFAATEQFIREKITQTVQKSFGLTPSRITDEAIIYSSKLFHYFLTQIFRCGSTAYEKRIPSKLLNLEKSRLRYLLQGYFDGDGSTERNRLKVSCDTVSEQLIQDLYFVLARYGIYFKRYTSTRKPGKPLQLFYIKKGRKIPEFTSTKITIVSNHCSIFSREIGFSLPRKQSLLESNLKKINPRGTVVEQDQNYTYLKIKSITKLRKKETTYCLNVEKNHNFIANNFIVHNCDGDEAAVMLLMDAFLNFSRRYLPKSRGSTMDAPLVLTSQINPAEVDDQVLDIDVVWKYPLELYEAALELKNPWEVRFGDDQKVEQLGSRLGKENQFENMGFTHDTKNFNEGILCSAYKTLPSMQDKLMGQMEIAQKVNAVDMDDVAKLVIQKHFLRDIKGNLRKFSMQQFRCVSCNTKFRRPPLSGRCGCGKSKIIFTISHGSVVKYLGHSMALAEKYDFSPYLKQTLDILQADVDMVFGREKEKQVGLGDFMK